jgi:hypothetical protein
LPFLQKETANHAFIIWRRLHAVAGKKIGEDVNLPFFGGSGQSWQL